MGYVIAAVLVLLIVGGFVLFLVTNATRKSNVSDAGDPGAYQNALGIVGSDDRTPAGDTDQHADVQADSRFKRAPMPSTEEATRPVVGGEAEGHRSPN